MTKTKKRFAKVLAFLMVFSIAVTSLNLSVFAMSDTNDTDEIDEASTVQEAGGDSQFMLANPDLYMPEDYNPEKEYEEEKANYALQLAREEDPDYASAEAENLSENTARSAETRIDAWVLLTQKWLNQEYGNVPGFGSVEESGRTGNDTIYGLIRALQHELGIASITNNFGGTTSALYEQNILKPGMTDRKVALLIGALLCKGYNPGQPSIPYYNGNGDVVFNLNFNSGVDYAIKTLKSHIYGTAIIEENGDVTLNIMKVLMSMKTFTLLTNYGGKAEVREMQQKFNRKYEQYFVEAEKLKGLIPCDGVFGRETNLALIVALQAIEGLPTGTASGTFGPTTKKLLPQIPYVRDGNAAKTYQNTYYTDAQISELIELVQFSLYLNGFGYGDFNGYFFSETQKNLRDFQKHLAIPVTEKVETDTWMSLFISSGNPDRSAPAADCAQPLTPTTVKTLYDNGYRYIGRYLTGTYSNGHSKALTVQEVNDIFAGGLRFFPIYQAGQYSVTADANIACTYFTPEKGASDAEKAIDAALKLGIPHDTIIYFAVDFDAQDSHITSNVLPYFQKVNEVMSKSIYKTGIYGTRNVCNRVSAKGYTVSSFVAGMSTGWSGNLGYKIPDDWAFSQVVEYSIGSGAGQLGVDKNAFSGRDQGVASVNKVSKKAVYVLPGYMGSKLYTPDDKLFFIEGTGMDFSLANPANIPLSLDIEKNALIRKSSAAMLNTDGSGSKLHVSPGKDQYGAINTYEPLVKALENLDGYSIEFFPYNWLGDLNDSVNALELDIKRKGYTDVVFVTHSTGGLLASAFVAKNEANKQIIKKQILVAAPLFGTYTSLAPLETGTASFLGEPYQLMDAILTAFPASTIIYESVKNWIKDVTYNSPTTYQLLPSEEYLKLMPQLYADDFKKGKPVTTADEYYNILNGSSNINSNLTNGNNRSHKYFRETVLGGNIESVIRTVDTVLIASEVVYKGTDIVKTPAIASYEQKLFGGTKLRELVYRQGGDNTVLYASATANIKEDGENVRRIEKNLDHTALIQDTGVIQNICDEIIGIKSDADSGTSTYAAVNSIAEDSGMTDMIKINYSCSTDVQASIYDNAQNEVAKVSSKDFSGFDGCNFIFTSYADEPGTADATIYMPNNGYKIVFSHGKSSGISVDFEAEVSALDYDGWKSVSVANSALKTTTNGIILSIDGTTKIIDNSNISSVVSGTVKNHFTDWQLPEIINLNKGNAQAVNITGSEAAQVSSLLNWSSADESVVTVSSTGVLTAVGFGKTTIFATDGNKALSCQVVVKQNATSVNISDVNMVIDERTVIKPAFAPATATETAMTYTYDKGGIIEIDKSGVIHSLSSGTVTVTGTTDYGVSTSFTVTVTDPDMVPNQDGTVIDSGMCGTNAAWSYYDTGLLSIIGTGDMYDYDYDIDSNDDFISNAPWWQYATSVRAVKVEDGITHIGDYSFFYYTSLESINLPESLKTIGESAFEQCIKLENLILPESLTTIDSNAFNECEKLKSVIFPNSLTSIGSGTFYGCSSLTSLKLPNGLKTIKDNTFYGCEALTDLTLPTSLETIETRAFSRCYSLTGLTLPNSLKYIGDRAFAYSFSSPNYCYFTLFVPESVTYIGWDAFVTYGDMDYKHTAVSCVILANSETVIGDSAFGTYSDNPVKIYGYKGSTAERFASSYNHLAFVPMSGVLPDGNILGGTIETDWNKYLKEDLPTNKTLRTYAERTLIYTGNGGQQVAVYKLHTSLGYAANFTKEALENLIENSFKSVKGNEISISILSGYEEALEFYKLEGNGSCITETFRLRIQRDIDAISGIAEQFETDVTIVIHKDLSISG